MTEPTGYNPAIDDSDEIWKPIPGYDDWYEVSNHGRVRSWRQQGAGKERVEPRIFVAPPDRDGYPHVHLRDNNGRSHTRTVHTLVAAAFIGPRPEGYDINHINGVKSDNRVENLEYVTSRENSRHARDELGKANSSQVLSRQQAEEIIALLTEGRLMHIKIANLYSITKDTVSDIWSGRSWKDLPRPYPSNIHYRTWRKIQHEKGNTTCTS